MSKRVAVCAAIAAACLSGTQSHADASLFFGGDEPMRIDIRDGKVRMEEAGKDEFVVYDTATQTITQVDGESKSYAVIDEASMARLGAELNSQRDLILREMEAQLANLPEDERKALIAAIPALAPAGEQAPRTPAPKPRFTGETGRYGGAKCRIASAVLAGEPSTVCLADADGLGISEKDYQAILDMYDGMTRFARQFPFVPTEPDFDGLGGVPIFISGDEDSALEKVSTEKLDPGLFKAPAGFKQQELSFE